MENTAPTLPPATQAPRTINNVMRHYYKTLNDSEKAALQDIKDKGLALHEAIHNLHVAGSRELSIAKTKCEESVMWAVKHITK